VNDGRYFGIEGSCREKRMKILQVVSGANEVAGVQKHAGYLAQSSRFEHVLATFPSPAYENWLTQNNIRFVVIRSFWDLWQFALVFKPDILHAHLGKALLSASLVKRMLKNSTKLFYTQHIFLPASETAQGAMGKAKRFIMRKAETDADCVIAVSKAVQEKYKVRAPNAKVKVIYNGNRLSFHSPVTRKPGPPWKILGACRMEQEKQPHLFLKLAEELDSDDFEIHVYGSGQLLDKMKERNRQNKSKTKVIYHGWSSDLKQNMAESNFAVHFGKEEAFSLGLIEFLNAALPTLALNHTSVPELFQGKFGVLIEPDRFSDMAIAIREMTQDTLRRESLGQKAFQRSLEFSEKEWIQKTDEAYLESEGTAPNFPNIRL
jgi:glycosyltransferase involved in cell wall biosynthesis